MTDKEEINVPGVSDFSVNHKARRNIAIPIGHLVLGVREESGVVTLLHNQECDLWIVVGVDSLNSSENGSHLHSENLINFRIFIKAL
jgi:hypothetical protein